MKKYKFKRNSVVLIIACVAIYVACQAVLRCCFSLRTEIVQKCTIEDIIETEGLAVRDELVIYNENKDNLKYMVGDSDKVACEQTVAQAYKTAQDAKISCKIDEIDNEIKTLEKLSTVRSNPAKGFKSINYNINGKIREMSLSLCNGDYQNAEDNKQKILYLLNERQIMLGKNTNLDDKVEKLKEERSRLCSVGYKNFYNVTAPKTGNFINNIDGFENSIDYKNLLKTDINKIEIQNLPKLDLTGSEIGKIICNNTWYMICVLSEQDAKRINVGKNLDIQLSDIGFSQDISCKVEIIAQKDNQADFVVIFSCNDINQSVMRLRKTNFKIKIGSYTGLKINKNSIHQKEKSGDFVNDITSGVYIKFGNYLLFKKITPIFVNDLNVICSFNESHENDKSYLQHGDAVVVCGTNLYDGKAC